MVAVFMLALAVSMDGFGVAVTYGLRHIRVPVICIFIVSLCSGMITLLAMSVAQQFADWMSADQARQLGAWVLIILGMYVIAQKFIHIQWYQYAIVIQILHTPLAADRDDSGNISPIEAVWLGIALSLDASGAGVGAAWTGLSPIITSSVIAISGGLFIALGLRVGYQASDRPWMYKYTWFPGSLLILLGMIKLLL